MRQRAPTRAAVESLPMPTRLTLALLLLLALPLACRQEPAPPSGGGELVTEEVEPPPDHRVDPSTDPRERRRSQGTGGVLPGDFPKDFPLPEGATLTGFGGGEEEAAWVELMVPQPLATVRQRHSAQLRAAGWDGPTGSGPQRKGGRTVEVELGAAGPSTRLRVRY
jgi:hypothetical protein